MIELDPEDFPVMFAVVRADTREVIWESYVLTPGIIAVPCADDLGLPHPLTFPVTFVLRSARGWAVEAAGVMG